MVKLTNEEAKLLSFLLRHAGSILANNSSNDVEIPNTFANTQTIVELDELDGIAREDSLYNTQRNISKNRKNIIVNDCDMLHSFAELLENRSEEEE